MIKYQDALTTVRQDAFFWEISE